MSLKISEHTYVSLAVLLAIVGAAFILGGRLSSIEQKVDDLTRLVYQILPKKLTIK